VAWFKVDDGLHASRKLLSIPKRSRFAAVGLWTVAGSWCADQLTDGLVPDYMLTVWGAPPAAPQSLVDAGLWERASDGYLFCNWLEYQPRKEDVDAERAASRERMRELRAKRKQKKTLESAENEDVFGRTGTNGSENVRNPDPTRPDPTPINTPTSEISDEIPRPEIDELLDLLDTCLEHNGSKKPSRTKKNTDAARLLIDKDGYTVNQVAWMIRWATSDEFWRTNILSMSKLREKFDQLKAKAGVGAKAAQAGFHGEIDVNAVLGRDLWTPGTPPPGLSVAEEIEWKKQQRAAHMAERLEEAKRKLGVAA